MKNTPILTTGEFVPGRPIAEILGIVEGGSVYSYLESVVDRFAPGIGRGRRESNEKGLAVARREALNEMIENARGMGADAVISMRYNFTTSGVAFFAVAYGTAVKLAYPVVKAAPASK